MSAKDTKKRALTPRLRFPEFRDAGEWEMKPLAACLEYQQPTPYLVSGTNYNSSFVTPVLTAGKTFVLGYTNEKDGIFSEGLPVIIFDDFTTSTQFVDFPFKGKSSAMKILQAKKSANIKFMYEVLQNISYYTDTHERHWISKFAPMPVKIPPLREQQKIADCLSSLDERIDAETSKLNALKAHKKGLLQQLFPAEGGTTPRLRFSEFRDAGEWGKTALGELLVSQPDYGVNAPAVPYSAIFPTYIRITDISEDGQFITANKVSVDVISTHENCLCDGDIVLARTGASVGKAYKYKKEDGKLIFAGFLIRIKPDFKKIHSSFLFNFFFTKQYWKWVEITSPRSGQPGINSGEYAALLIPLPPCSKGDCLLEQQRIADCLSSLDELIAAQARKIELLKTHKKGLLQQLFPACDEADA